jgi:hypothetical protein
MRRYHALSLGSLGLLFPVGTTAGQLNVCVKESRTYFLRL